MLRLGRHGINHAAVCWLALITCDYSWDPDTVPTTHWFASCFVLLELLTREPRTQVQTVFTTVVVYEYDQVAGITIVLDLAGFSFKHIRWA